MRLVPKVRTSQVHVNNSDDLDEAVSDLGVFACDRGSPDVLSHTLLGFMIP